MRKALNVGRSSLLRDIVIFHLTVFSLIMSETVWAQVPQLINYQGRIVVGSTNFTGTGSFKFALVNATGTTAYWTNDGTHLDGTEPTNAVALSVSNSLFSVLLGDTSLPNMTPVSATVFNNADVRLRVWFNDGTHGWEQLGPDQRIAAVGYAAIAGNVPDGAITSNKIANGSIGIPQVANGAITSAKIANGAVGSTQLANGAVTSADIDTASVQKRITGSAPAGQFIKSINPDGTIVAGGVTPAGSSSQLQFNNSGAFGGLANVKYDAGKNSLTLFGDIPFDLDHTYGMANGAKLSIFGNFTDKPSFAIIGGYRSGGVGTRYTSWIGGNGDYFSNASMTLNGIDDPRGDTQYTLGINTDVPVAISVYDPFSAGGVGFIFNGWGSLPTDGVARKVYQMDSQGSMQISNPCGTQGPDNYPRPQLIIQDSSPDTLNTTYRSTAFKFFDGELDIGTYSTTTNAFQNSGTWAGLPEIRIRPGKVDFLSRLVLYTGLEVGSGQSDPGAGNLIAVGTGVFGGRVTAASFKPVGVTVAGLPGSPQTGTMVYVTDGQASLAWGATVTGGGGTKYLVWFNGTHWTVMGK